MQKLNEETKGWNTEELQNTIEDLRTFTQGKTYNTIYADPPWQFQNRTGKVAPEHKRLKRYETMTMEQIKRLPIEELAGEKAHLYLWVPNALLPDGLAVMDAWGLNIREILSGRRFARTVNRMAGGSVFIFVM